MRPAHLIGTRHCRPRVTPQSTTSHSHHTRTTPRPPTTHFRRATRRRQRTTPQPPTTRCHHTAHRHPQAPLRPPATRYRRRLGRTATTRKSPARRWQLPATRLRKPSGRPSRRRSPPARTAGATARTAHCTAVCSSWSPRSHRPRWCCFSGWRSIVPVVARRARGTGGRGGNGRRHGPCSPWPNWRFCGSDRSAAAVCPNHGGGAVHSILRLPHFARSNPCSSLAPDRPSRSPPWPR